MCSDWNVIFWHHTHLLHTLHVSGVSLQYIPVCPWVFILSSKVVLSQYVGYVVNMRLYEFFNIVSNEKKLIDLFNQSSYYSWKHKLSAM